MTETKVKTFKEAVLEVFEEATIIDEETAKVHFDEISQRDFDGIADLKYGNGISANAKRSGTGITVTFTQDIEE